MSDPDAFTAALIAELSKKTGVCWLRYGGQERAAWHVWLEDALYLVSGGDEQPLPGIAEATRVEVVMRSKDNGGRLLTWVGDASVVTPEDERWTPVTIALVAGRLNLPDLTTAADGWAAHSTVTRVVPAGPPLESPGALDDSAQLAAPRPSKATTRGPLPRVLHRRGKGRPRLS